MSIVINGSGSISGISAGGISDAGAIADSAMGAGAVLQVVSRGTTTTTATTGTSYVSTDIYVDITPTSASSNILVIAHFNAYHNQGGRDVMFSLFRDSTQMSSGIYGHSQFYIATSSGLAVPASIHELDSPSTTSTVRYMVKFRMDGATGTASLNINGSRAVITAMEIAA